MPDSRKNAYHNGREGNYNNEVTFYNRNLPNQSFRFNNPNLYYQNNSRPFYILY